ncbi:hypothetical protein BGW38_007674 [Lunasporangiospora selenospora]|uniref:BTB domain-containing protein n=1 Tax=Lunasporangiospora selenospora TaxID=979761 RepID=A0A9P6KIY2_9FUNG|nr:hypothetical protein BGW38_007674 [Lunasporangiospora selenospora]
MRTAELINHLRSRNRNSHLIKVQLEKLDSARQIHLIGELTNWLAADLRRYRSHLQIVQDTTPHTNGVQKKQAGDTPFPNPANRSSMTTQLESLQSQIRQSLLAILIILDGSGFRDHGNQNVDSHGAPIRDMIQSGSSNPKAVVMDSKDKMRILKSLVDITLSCLQPMLPRNDPRVAQIPSVKILHSLIYNSLQHSKSECTTSREMLFEPEQVLEALRSVGASTPSPSLVSGIKALLNASDTHLRECALRILTIFRQLDKTNALTWEVTCDLKPILQELTVSIEATMAGVYKDFELGVDVGLQDRHDQDQNQTTVLESTKHSKVLVIILQLMREAGSKGFPRTMTTDSASTTSPTSIMVERFTDSQEPATILASSDRSDNSKGASDILRDQDASVSLGSQIVKLKEAVPLPILIDLWAAIQTSIVLGFSQLKITDEIVQTTTALVYWAYWIYGKEATEYMTERGAVTLIAWYGYVIVPNETGTSSGTGMDPHSTEKEDALKSRSSILEYLARLLQNLVKARSLQDQNGRTIESSVFAGTKPLGMIIVRRTIEFLESILDSTLPLSRPAPDLVDDFDQGPTSISYSVRLVQLKPAILEAMLDLMVTCFGRLWEVDELVLCSRSLDLLLLLISNADGLFWVQEQKKKHRSSQSQQTWSYRIQKLSLRLLYQILHHDQKRLNIRIADITLPHWEIGYAALVEIILGPLEQAAGLAPSTKVEIDPYPGVARSTNGEGVGLLSATDSRNTVAPGKDDNGIWALRVLRLLWRYHPKGHSLLPDLLGPRLFKIQMIRAIIPPRTVDAPPSVVPFGTGSPAPRKTLGEGTERIKLLLGMMTMFGTESSVRINMREHWSTLLFIAILLAIAVKNLESKSFTDVDALDRVIIQSCLQALLNFYYDKQGLLRMIELGTVTTISEEERSVLEDFSVTDLLCSFSTPAPTSPMDEEIRSPKTLSIVPALVAIICPAESHWDVDIMLQEPEKRRKRHPLFEAAEPFMTDAAVVMNQLLQFLECQQMLIAKPGLVWTLTRMMVERSLVTFYQERMNDYDSPSPSNTRTDIGFSTLCAPIQTDRVAGTFGCDEEEGFPVAGGEVKERSTRSNAERNTSSDVLERTLLEMLTKVVSSMKLVKFLVSNNTLTELYSAILDIDVPLYFYGEKILPRGKNENIDKCLVPLDPSMPCSYFSLTLPRWLRSGKYIEMITLTNRKQDLQCKVQGDASQKRNDYDLSPTPKEQPIVEDHVFPPKVLRALQKQLLQYFRTVMAPCRDQLERIYQYVGGHRGTYLQSLDETDDVVYWLREYCALVFLYISEPLDLSSPIPSTLLGSSLSIAWGGRSGGNLQQLDKTMLLSSDSVFGVACRMLTLEIEFDDEAKNEAEGERQVIERANYPEEKGLDTPIDKATLEKARPEEAGYRRFSAGLAIQSIAWRNIDIWSQGHAEFIRSYDEVMTTEWSQHVARLSDLRRSPHTDQGESSASSPDPIQFLIQDRVIPFPDRAFLARVSPYFETLLMGNFRERYEKQIRLYDVNPDEIEILLEIIQESPLTCHHLLPPDLPLELVLRVMVCAERLMVRFVKRLAEKWVLDYLTKKETKYIAHYQGSQEQIRRRQSPDELENKERRKRIKLDHAQSFDNTPTRSVEQTPEDYENVEEMGSEQDTNVGDYPTEGTNNPKDNDDGLSIQECLVMVYEACSIPEHGSIYQRDGHPFYGLVWDVLKRMVIRLGSVGATPQFLKLLESRSESRAEEASCQAPDRDETRIQDLLQILYELITNSVPE